jgi:hypothetical protein
MADLQALFEMIERLEPEDVEEVRRFIEQHQPIIPPKEKDPELRILALQEALNEFREGLSKRELKLILEAMNIHPSQVRDLSRWAWLEDVPEDEV